MLKSLEAVQFCPPAARVQGGCPGIELDNSAAHGDGELLWERELPRERTKDYLGTWRMRRDGRPT